MNIKLHLLTIVICFTGCKTSDYRSTKSKHNLKVMEQLKDSSRLRKQAKVLENRTVKIEHIEWQVRDSTGVELIPQSVTTIFLADKREETIEKEQAIVIKQEAKTHRVEEKNENKKRKIRFGGLVPWSILAVLVLFYFYKKQIIKR